MKTLTDWVAEFNSLVQEIGRPVLERAQGYYDSRAIWQQAIQDFAEQQGVLDRVNLELEVAVKNLAKAETAFEAFLRGSDALSDQQWEELAPAKVGDENDAELDSDPKLLRMIRVSRLGDTVANLQTRRDREVGELTLKRDELEEARRRFESEDQMHSACTWNCSVKRAAPFYEKRRLHEFKVDQQLTQLHAVERRLSEARKHLAEVQGAESPASVKRRSQSRQIDELSLQSFEIAGAEPAHDEFLSSNYGIEMSATGSVVIVRQASQMRRVSAIEREVARSARAHADRSTAKDAVGPGSATGTAGDEGPDEQACRERAKAREARHAVLVDAVRGVVVWTLCAMLHLGLVWMVAHFTVSLHLTANSSSLAWMLLGSLPVFSAERFLQRSAAGINLRGISGDGPLQCRGVPLPSLVPLPLLPGAPWFGPRIVRLAAGSTAGLSLAALARLSSPFAAALGGCAETVLLLVRAAYACIWICDWRLQQMWRKRK
ncbi:unnamed protein product [Symbiodinium microadriaticum]|nr:unnamed protein product [Symbiodinium microadriaticum]